MLEKKYYLTTQINEKDWNYIGDPINPNTTMDAGIVKVDRTEISVDMFGAYVTKLIN